MIVYVVTEGEYSDYHIVAVTTDKETAERIREQLCDCNEVLEYDTDDYTPLRDRELYYVRLEGRGVFYCRPVRVSCMYYPDRPGIVETDRDGDKYVYVYGKDKDHAKKIAADLFAQYEAERKGVT